MQAENIMGSMLIMVSFYLITYIITGLFTIQIFNNTFHFVVENVDTFGTEMTTIKSEIEEHKILATNYDLLTRNQRSEYDCVLCVTKMGNKSDHLDHLITHQTNYNAAQTHTCHICSEVLEKLSDYNKHMYGHNSIEKFACKKCGVTCISEYVLSVHMLVHMKDNYECKECGYTYQQRKEFEQHLCKSVKMSLFKIKKEPCPASPKKYMCGECGKFFKNPSSVRSHKIAYYCKADRLNKLGQYAGQV